MITNNYGTSDCDGLISPLPFLSLNQVSIKSYASTTFYHAKYMSRDGKAASVSSINFSKTSYTVNREAGVLVEGSADAIKFMTSVFEDDWSRGSTFVVNQTYSSADMKIITDTAKRSYSMPYIKKGMSPSPVPKAASDISALKVFTSPDSAYDTVIAQLSNATKSVGVEIYQVTDDALCSFLESTQKSGIELKLLVSKYIFGPKDHMLASGCYKKLQAAGVTVRMTQDISFYQYCHQKFWIVDGKTVGISTGNWSPSDYPEGGKDFVTYKASKSSWRDSNRDYTLMITSPTVVDTFQKVLDTDYSNGEKLTFTNGPKLSATPLF
jgi:phosphatidylserine/phosphatidylglycerophosphate/cardiolipin synthase-like enzyme